MNACEMLEQLGEEAQARPQQQQTPGFVILIQNVPTRASLGPSVPVTIEQDAIISSEVWQAPDGD